MKGVQTTCVGNTLWQRASPKGFLSKIKENKLTFFYNYNHRPMNTINKVFTLE